MRRVLLTLLLLVPAGAAGQEADLILHGRPRLDGRRGAAVGHGGGGARRADPRGRRCGRAGAAPHGAHAGDRRGRALVTPGFIDNHTHFNQAGALLLGASTCWTSPSRGSSRGGCARRATGCRPGVDHRRRLGRVRGLGRAPPAARRAPQARRFSPDRALIDSVTPTRSCSRAGTARSTWRTPSRWSGGARLRRAGGGARMRARPCDGRVAGEALRACAPASPEKTQEQRLREARLALAQLRDSA
jgi:hypothetical protein